MELVNLKKYYPCLYAKDTLIEVSDEVAEAIRQSQALQAYIFRAGPSRRACAV